MKKLTEEEMSQVNGGYSGACIGGLTMGGAGILVTAIGAGIATCPAGWLTLIGGGAGILGFAFTAYGCGSERLIPLDVANSPKGDIGTRVEL